MIKAVIFDADGMVVTGERFSERFSETFRVPLSAIDPFFQNEFQLCLVGKADLREELKKYTTAWKWEKSIDELLAFWFSTDVVNARMHSAILALEKENIVCVLATKQEKYRSAYLLETLGLGKLFSTVFNSATCGFKKPEREFYAYIIRGLFPLAKHEILYWDDKPDYVQKAKEFGFAAECYTSFSDFEEKLCQYLKR